MKVEKLLEQQFESELVLQCTENGKNQMRLLMDKKRAAAYAREEAIEIFIPDEALLLLTK